MVSDYDAPDELLQIDVTDTLDLHSFRPREVPSLVRDYLDLALEAGFSQVRIIHGRGRGVQRRTVRTLALRHPRVQGVNDAPLGSGGWGASIVVFSSSETS